MATPPPPFATERLILCEGIEDAVFIRALIKHYGLAFDVRPNQDVGGISGIGGFATTLARLVVEANFSSIKHIVLVADADVHHGDNFAKICRQIEAANADPNVSGRFGIPSQAYQRSGGYPPITVIMLPAPPAKWDT